MGVVVVVVVVVVVGMIRLSRLRGQPFQAKHHSRIHNPTLHGQHRCTGAHPLREALTQQIQLSPIDAVSPTDQHLIGGLELIVEQILNGTDVIKAGILLTLAFQSVCVTNRTS